MLYFPYTASLLFNKIRT